MATMTHDEVRTQRLSGLAVALLSAASFGLSGALARGVMDAGWSAGAAVAARILVAAVVLVPVALVRLRGDWSLVRRHLGLIVAYGLVAVAGCQLAYYHAVARLDVSVALLIEYTAPVAVVLWLWARHGQRPGRLTAVGAVLGAAGLVLVLDLVSGAHVDAIGTGWALVAMSGAAVYFVLSSRDTGLPATVLAAGGLLVGGTTLLLAGLVGLVPLAASTARVSFAGFGTAWWPPVLALGLVTAALAYTTGIAATRRLGSRLASFVALTEVLFALSFAWLLLGQAPRPVQAAGGVLILAGLVVVNLGETRTAGPEPAPAPEPAATPVSPAPVGSSPVRGRPESGPAGDPPAAAAS